MKDPMFQPCAAWAEKLAATHPDDLSPTQWAELEAHITHCPACAAIRNEYRLMDSCIRSYSAGQTLLHPPFPLPIPGQLANNGDDLLLPILDRVYSKSLRSWLSWYAPSFSTILHRRWVSLAILMAIVCLMAGALLGMYVLKTVGIVLN